MRKILISLFIGFVAGIIDVIPMILQKLDLYSCASAFVQWIVLGVIISHLEIGLKGWLKGLIIAEATAIPILILVAKTDLISVLPIMIMSAILGSFVGIIGEKYAK
jgi:hypothetical protein